MKSTKIYYNKELKLKDPIMIVGLPGIGGVGSLVAEHLKNEFKAKKFATLYSPHFIHQTIMLSDGRLRLVNNRFYHANIGKKDVVLLVGDTQATTPEGQYEVNEKIVKFFKTLGGKSVYTVGGYNISGNYVDYPRVFGVATTKKMIESLSDTKIIFGKATGAVWGSAGLIPAFSKKYNIDAACVMGETGVLEIDANAAKSVLQELSKVLSVKINLNNIDKIKKETERVIKEMEEAAKNMPENQQPTRDNLSYIR